MSKRKQVAVTLEVKKAIIEAAKKNDNKTALAKQFNIPHSTLRGILKDKEAVLKAIEDGGSAKRARLKTGKYVELEEVLVLWIKQVRSQNLPVSGELVKVSLFLLFICFNTGF